MTHNRPVAAREGDRVLLYNKWTIDRQKITSQAELSLFMTVNVRAWIRELIDEGWALSGDTELATEELVDADTFLVHAQVWGVPPQSASPATDEKPTGYIKGQMTPRSPFQGSYIQTDAMLALSTILDLHGCTHCGVLVFDKETHNNYHEENDPWLSPTKE